MTDLKIKGRRSGLLASGFLVALALLPSASAVQAAIDPDCSLPPADAWVTGRGGTWDRYHLWSWVTDRNTHDAIWYGLRLERSDWNEGWGYYDIANLDMMLPRLMNAGYVVIVVEQFAKHPGHGFWLPVRGIPDPLYTHGGWWAYAADYGEDEWQPACESGGAVYRCSWLDCRYELRLTGAYMKTAIYRGSIVVHETVHDTDGVGHIDEDDCSPSTTSCDYTYGAYNPNTLQINFLMDAAVALRSEEGSDGAHLLVARHGDLCSYIPLFSTGERHAAVFRIGKLIKRFAYKPLDPSSRVRDRWNQERFDCEHCKPTDHDFDPSVCSQKACNEVLNPDNAAVNGVNKIACLAYNNDIDQTPGLTPEEIAAYRATMQSNSRPCLAASEEGARPYCESEKATAAEVNDIDECGWLQGVHLPDISLQQCVEEYCFAQLSEYAGLPADWIAQDTAGCLDFLCSDESCPNHLSKALCIKGFQMAQGNPDLYAAQCRWERCERATIECLAPLYDAGQWVPGDSFPDQCEMIKAACELKTKLATLAFINQKPFLEPGPYRDIREQFHHGNPVGGLDTFMDAFREAAANGASGEELERMAVEFTSLPEFVSVLYHSAPGEFVWMFGKEGFSEVLGPSIRDVEPVAIDAEGLSEQGRRALAELESLMTEEGLEEALLNIGSFAPPGP